MVKRLLLLCVLLPLTAYAQEQLPPDLCTEQGRVILIEELEKAIGELQANDDPETLLYVQALIASYRADCANLTFTSTEYGADVVTDPILFPSGAYRVTLEGTASTSLLLEGFDGDCDFLSMFVAPSVGARQQDVLRLDRCVGSLDISGQGDWTLTFEPIVLPGS